MRKGGEREREREREALNEERASEREEGIGMNEWNEKEERDAR